MSNEASEKNLVEKYKKYMMPIPGSYDVVFVESKGSIFKDINDKEYIDFGSCVAGTTSVGANNKRVIEAVKKQIDKMVQSPGWAINIPILELAEKLSKITPGNLNKFHFILGGMESVEYALHMAIRISGKKEVIGLNFGYHGASFGTLNLGQTAHRRKLPAIPTFKQIPPAYCYRCFYGKKYPECNFECAKALDSMIKYGSYGDVAAFIAEPVLGNGGHIIPPKEYFKIIREICDKNNVLLIIDEIQTTLGRTGKIWGIDYYEVVPDIMTIGKALGGGFPISASIYKDDLPLPPMEDLETVSTFANHAMACSAASSVVDIVLEEKLPDRVQKIGNIIMERLNEMKEKHLMIGDVRGLGLFNTIELVKDRSTKEKAIKEAAEFAKKCREKGLLVFVSTKANVGNVILIKPPYTIPEEIVKRGLDIIEEVFVEMNK